MRSSRKSSRRVSVSGPVLCAGLLVAFVLSGSLGCAWIGKGGREVVPDDVACAVLDSALAGSGLRADVAMAGKVTIDVNQYRVRGRFELTLDPEGNLTFDMNSTTLLGGHREDAVLSFFDDQLYVLDRERGQLHEGTDVDHLVAEGAGVDVDLGELLRLVTARHPDCARVTAVRRSPENGSIEGLIDGGRFELRFERGRLSWGRWMLPLRSRSGRDQLEATYSWSGRQLTGFTVYVPDRRWRIKLSGEAP